MKALIEERERTRKKNGSQERTIFADAVGELKKSVKGFRGAVISSTIGFPFAFDLPPEKNPVDVAAACSSIYNTVSDAAAGVGAGEPKYCMVSLGDVVLLSLKIGASFILMVLLSPDADANSAIGAAGKTAEKVNSLLAA